MTVEKTNSQSLRLDLSFYCMIGSILIFFGGMPLLAGILYLRSLPVWAQLLCSALPIQLAYIASTVIPCIKYPPAGKVRDFLSLRVPEGKWIWLAVFGTILLYMFLASVTSLWVVILRTLNITVREQPVLQILRGCSWSTFALMAPVALILAPAGEEFCFRMIIFDKLDSYSGKMTALYGSCLFFAAIHLNLQSFPALTLLAFYLVWLRMRSTSMLTNILAHAVFNLCTMTLILLFRLQILHLPVIK